ncbi:MAG: sulfatase [Thermoguttaceae bacterium]|jgi:N-sulfoglucosamine sulfohydrolase|nr:sulfatase [Thermoguttaceae bacterium]
MFVRMLLTCVALGWSSLASAAEPRPNVVLFVVDDQGRDAGCYGNPRVKTPNLDRLAAEGTRFDYAFCTTASCSASRSVLLTGLHNHANGQYGHEHAYHHFRTFDNVKSLPVLLSQSGYRTVRIGKFHVGPPDVYRFDRELPGNARNPVAMAETCRAVLAEKDQRPLFLYFCTADPHRSGNVAADLPGRPDRFGNRPQGYPGVKPQAFDPKQVVVPPFLPDTPECRAELAQYYQAVWRVDQGLGRLVEILKETGQYDRTLIVFLSDNGIAFPGAKTTLYEPGMRLPCVVRAPAQKKRGVVSSAMISWADITPTILDAAGALPEKNPFHGRSFLHVLDEPNPAGWDEVYASHTFHEITMYYPMRVVRTRQYKLIWNLAHGLSYPFASDLWESSTWQSVWNAKAKTFGRRSVEAFLHRPAFELYDLAADPDEIHNLANDPKHASVLESLQAKLKAFQERTGDPWIVKWEHE